MATRNADRDEQDKHGSNVTVNMQDTWWKHVCTNTATVPAGLGDFNESNVDHPVVTAVCGLHFNQICSL